MVNHFWVRFGHVLCTALVITSCSSNGITGPDPVRDTDAPAKPAAQTPAPQQPLAFEGTAHFRASGGSASLTIQKIVNNSTAYTSGSLRIDLWATSSRYTGGDISGYRTASIRTSEVTGLADQLRPNAAFSNISANLAYSDPPSGYGYFTLILAEFKTNCGSADHYCVAAALPMAVTSTSTAHALGTGDEGVFLQIRKGE
jgi:hypothetical protein